MSLIIGSKKNYGEIISVDQAEECLEFLDKDDALSLEAITLYRALCKRSNCSVQNNWKDKDGRIFVIYAQDKAMKKLQCPCYYTKADQ